MSSICELPLSPAHALRVINWTCFWDNRSFSVAVSTAYGFVTRLDMLMIAVKELVGEHYHIHGAGLKPNNYRDSQHHHQQQQRKGNSGRGAGGGHRWHGDSVSLRMSRRSETMQSR